MRFNMKKPLQEKARQEAGDESELEKKLYSIEDMPSPEESKLYMQNGGSAMKGLMEKVKGYWNQMKPNNVQEAVASVVIPTPYYLWKLPPDVHKTMNDILGAATDIAAKVNPEVGIATGLAYGISQVIYGLKTGSGKHTGAGLVGIAEHIKRAGSDEHQPILEKIEEVIQNYFHGFKPSYATA
jgi:hypothetical protein